MSFAEGFGEGFRETFGQAIRQNAQEREDQFKMIYDTYLQRRQLVEQQRIADEKLANKAKALVQTFGGTVDPRAWPQVYNWMQAGLPDDQIADNLRRGKFNFSGDTSQSSTTQVPPDSGQGVPKAVTNAPPSDGSDVANQTRAAGMTPDHPVPPANVGSDNSPDQSTNPGVGNGVGAAAGTGAMMPQTADNSAPTVDNSPTRTVQAPQVGAAPVSPQGRQLLQTPGSLMGRGQQPPPMTPPQAPQNPHVRPDQNAPLPGTLGHSAAKSMPAPPPQAQAQMPAPQAPAPQNVSSDMTQSRTQMSQAPQMSPPGAVPQGQVSSNPVTGFFDKIYNNRMARNSQLATDRIANATGTSQDDVNAVLSQPYGPKIMDTSGIQFAPGPVRDPNDAQETLSQIAQERALAADRGDTAAVAMLDKKYNAVKNSMVDEANVKYMAEMKPAADALVSKVSPDIADYKDRTSALNNAIRDANIMSDAIKKTNGTVLNEYVAKKSDQSQVFLRDVTGSVDQIFDSIRRAGGKVPDGIQGMANKLTEYQNKLTAPGGNGLDNLAVQRGLFEIQSALFAYHLTQAAGLRGGNRGLSVDQLDTLQRLGTSGLNVDEFHQSMSDLLGNIQKNIETDGQMKIRDNPEVAQFALQHGGYVPPMIDYDLVKAQNQAAIDKDPDLKAGYQMLQDYSRDNPNAKINHPFVGNSVAATAQSNAAASNPAQATQPSAQPADSGPPAPAIEFLKKNPNLRGAFDLKYGQGASDKVLGAQ